jgi:hypothetical protein
MQQGAAGVQVIRSSPRKRGPRARKSNRWSTWPLGSRFRGNERVESRSIRTGRVLAAGLFVAALAAPAQAQNNQRPLVLSKASYFFVGGKIDPSVEGSAPVNHIYVEYMIPQRLTHRTPIVMVHGGSIAPCGA